MRKYMPYFLILVLLLSACGAKSRPVQETLSDGSYIESIAIPLSQDEFVENTSSVSIVLRQEDGSEINAQMQLEPLEDPSILPVDSWQEYWENGPFFPALRQRDDGSLALIFLNRHGQIMSRNRSVEKTVSYYSAGNALQWAVKLTASFHYDGLSAVCTGSYASVTIEDENSWQLVNQTVTGGLCTVTFRRTTLGVPTSTPTFTFQLTCDPEGNIS